LRLSKDGWTGLACLAASLVFFGLTLGLKESALVPIGPGFYPRIVLGITAVLAAALFAFSLIDKDKPAAADAKNYALVFGVFLVFGVYVGALPYLGYRLATFAFIAALQATLEPPKGRKAWTIVLASALVTTAVTYVVFEHYLTVLLPRGRWTGF
jgi:putative tricarboxylic transport membrane protein